MKGLNDDEICDFVDLTHEMVRLSLIILLIFGSRHIKDFVVFLFQPVDVRFIEYMPFDGKILNFTHITDRQRSII